jgi:3-oxoacyl-[acyl-carrier protein] reductase
MKTVVITGGSRGIGFSIVKELISKKYLVINISKNKNISFKNKNLFNYSCDIAKHKNVSLLFDKIYRKHGNFYALINNAGINPSRENLSDTSYKDFDRTLKTNIYGAFNCSKFFIKKKLINKNPGVIINISSIVGLVSHEKRASYSISKSAINGLTRSIVADYSHLKLRCFSICPGYVETDLTRNFLNKLGKIQKNKLVKKHKLGKLGYPKDVANLVSFLLDSKSSWMTGNILPLDGGYVS